MSASPSDVERDLAVRAGEGGVGGRRGNHQRDEEGSDNCGSDTYPHGSPPFGPDADGAYAVRGSRASVASPNCVLGATR